MRRNHDVDDSDRDASRPGKTDTTGVNRRAVLKAVGTSTVGLPALANAAAAHEGRDVALVSRRMTDGILVTNSENSDGLPVPFPAAREKLAAVTEDAAGIPVEVRQTTVYSVEDPSRERNAVFIEAQQPPADFPEDPEQVEEQLTDVLGETTDTIHQLVENEGVQTFDEEVAIASRRPTPYETPLKHDEVLERVQRAAQTIADGSVEIRPTVVTTLEGLRPVGNCEQIDPTLCTELEESTRNLDGIEFRRPDPSICWVCYWVCYWNHCWPICYRVC